jgi:hypothetical protein
MPATPTSTGTGLADPSSTALTNGSSTLNNLPLSTSDLISSDQIAASTGGSSFDPNVINQISDSTYGASTSAVDSSGGSLSGDLGSILSGLGSVASSPLGGLALYGGLYGLAEGQASTAAKQNNALTGQITSIGEPLVQQGQSELGQYGQGKLTTPFQTQLNAAEQTNQNNAISQQQQVASLLAGSGGGQNVEGAMASQSQQIQNAQSQLNTQAMSQAFTNELSSGLQLTAEGGGFVQQGILSEIQNNTQLSQQLSSLIGSLAEAYARQFGSSSGGSGGTGSLTSGVSSLTNGIGGLLNKVLGSGSTPSVSSLTAPNIGVSDVAGSLPGGAPTTEGIQSAIDSVATDPASIDLGSSVASDIGSFSASSASAGAADAGLTAADLGSTGITDAGITSAVSDAAAVDAGAVGSSAGSLSGTLSAIAPYAAPAIAAGVGIYELVNSLTKPNNPDVINQSTAAKEGLQVNPDGTLPSGNAVLADGSLGVGAGTQSSKGSGEIYQLRGNAAQDAANKADPSLNEAYHWVGQGDSTALEADASAINKNPNDQSALSSIQQIFNQTGGAADWGMSESDFVSSLHTLLDSGAYSSGNAFGAGN